MRDKKKRSGKVIVFLVSGLLLAAIPMTALAAKGVLADETAVETPSNAEEAVMPGNAEAETATPSNAVAVKAEITGSWTVDGYTGYRFEEDGTGALVLPEKEYAFSYTLEDDQLSIDFESSRASDGTYTVIVEADALTMTGGEGTIGGTYELERID